MKVIRRRPLVGPIGQWSDQVPEIIRRIYAARGVLNETDTELAADMLHPTSLLGGVDRAVAILIDAIKTKKSITVSGDYDCDGATGTAVAVRGLRMLGASNVRYVIPHRFHHGYGLSKGLVESMEPKPDIIVTVDSGVASLEGVAYAKSLGMTVIITDHHLPGDTLPIADAIVNPNLNGDTFPSKALAGVGVMFYTLMALRKGLQDEGMNAPPIRDLLDIVALGTVADLVPLDRNNRILVAAGLARIRKGYAHAGIKALMALTGKEAEKLCAQDFGFSIAPRINAAGRLEDMTIGVETLLCDNYEKAKDLVKKLDDINRERQSIQEAMMAEAEAIMEKAHDGLDDRIGIVVHEPHWHAGVVGLVASKLKESLHRPVFAFAPGEGDDPLLRGSGRSIEGFHLRDALALIDSRKPGLLPKFGGHAMAAGLSLDRERLQEFADLFDEVAKQNLTDDQLTATVLTDGELSARDINLELAEWIQWAGPWGQAFPQPCFDNVFETVAWHRMAGDHVKLRLRDPRSGKEFDGVYFRGYQEEPFPHFVRVAYELNAHTWHETTTLQLLVKTVVSAEGTDHHGNSQTTREEDSYEENANQEGSG